MGGPGHIGRFAAEENGTILVFVAIALAVLLGLLALSFDLGQRASTQSELQSFADQVAMAAAGELDGTPDAITRACSAAQTLIQQKQTFASGSQALSVANAPAVANPPCPGAPSVTFYSALPADDSMPLTATTTDPASAAYVRVLVQRQQPFSFWNAFAGLTGSATPSTTVTATAVAGFTEYACSITPMFFCVPSPTWTAQDNIGQMIHLRAGGGSTPTSSTDWTNGDFGFLSQANVVATGTCAGTSGATKTKCLNAAIDGAGACYAENGVTVKPGQSVGLENSSFNVRFDMYEQGLPGSWSSDPAFAPAPSVVKGEVPQSNACKQYNPSPDTIPLPRDTCFDSTGLCNGSRFGNGIWDRAAYVAADHGGVDPVTATVDPVTGGPLTRYHYYIDEYNAAAGNPTIIAPGLAETGRPSCSTAAPAPLDRRVIIAAAVPCDAYAAAGTPINGASVTPIHPTGFVKLFLTEPVAGSQSNNNFSMYAEVVGPANGGSGGAGSDDGIFHDFVELYR